jgi:hypothetical protein
MPGLPGVGHFSVSKGASSNYRNHGAVLNVISSAVRLKKGGIMEHQQINETLALGSVSTEEQAQLLIESLKSEGFLPHDLSVISPNNPSRHDPKFALDHKPGSDPADEKPRNLSNKLKSVTIGAVSGGLILGALGSLIGLISYAVPSLRFMISSPLAAALIYAAAGATAGVAGGALVGMRIPDYKTKQHAVDVRASRTIVSVRTQSPHALQRAMQILVAGGAAEVHEKIDEVTSH